MSIAFSCAPAVFPAGWLDVCAQPDSKNPAETALLPARRRKFRLFIIEFSIAVVILLSKYRRTSPAGIGIARGDSKTTNDHPGAIEHLQNRRQTHLTPYSA